MEAHPTAWVMHLWLTPATIYWCIFMCVLIPPSPLLHLFICNAQVSLMIASLSPPPSHSLLICHSPSCDVSFISSSSNLFFFKCCSSFPFDLFHPISHSLVCLPAHRRLSFHKTLSSSPLFSSLIFSFHSFYFKILIVRFEKKNQTEYTIGQMGVLESLRCKKWLVTVQISKHS